jgi:hypothetical protein
MKVGDLVMLSAAGKKISANWRCRQHGGFGIIKDVWDNTDYPYVIEWWSADMAKNHKCRFKRYEMKKYKPDKK